MRDVRRSSLMCCPCAVSPTNLPLSAVLASLPDDVAAPAREALNSLLLDEGEDGEWDVVSQLELQTFLWYSLPTKWLVDSREHHEVAWALGDFYRAAGKQRFADLCRAQHTHLLIDLWETDEDRARKELHRLMDLSGVKPPSIDSLTWGALMGLTETVAYHTASYALERAIEDGRLTPGGHGWRGHAVRITTAALGRGHSERPALSVAGAVRQERRDHWLADVQRRGLVLTEDLADAVTAPSVDDLPDDVVTPPLWGGGGPPRLITTRSDVVALEGVAASLEPLVWFLGEIGDGITLTQTGNLPRALVLAADERYDWFDLEPRSRLRSMWDLNELVALNELVTELRWVTRTGQKLRLSVKGRTMRDDPLGLARAVFGYLFNQRDWHGDGAVATATVLLGAYETLTTDEVYDRILHYLGTRWAREGAPLRERQDVFGASRRFDTLGAGFGWFAPLPRRDFRLHRPLNAVGRAACVTGLRHVVAGPWLRM